MHQFKCTMLNGLSYHVVSLCILVLHKPLNEKEITNSKGHDPVMPNNVPMYSIT